MRNSNLDVLRATAVTVVILSHLAPVPRDAPHLLMVVADWFRQSGILGVELFFVLSGFLVAGLLFREYSSTGSVRIGRFLIRRGFKIYPAFYVFTILTVLLRIKAGDTLTRANIAGELLFIQNYGGHIWTHTWSLAVEEQFYLLLAGLVFLLCRYASKNPLRWIPPIYVGTLAAVFVARAVTLVALPFTNETHQFPTHLQLDSLFLGVLIAYYWQSYPRFQAALKNHAPALLAGGVATLMVAQIDFGVGFKYLVGHILTTASFGMVVLAAVLAPSVQGTIGRFVAKLGSQSYSIYLWHTAVLAFGRLMFVRLVGRQPTVYETALWYVPGSFMAGVIMARVVEAPSLRLRERLFPDRRPGTGLPRTRLAATTVPSGEPSGV